MKPLRILMIEDTPWVGFILEEIIAEAAEADVTVVLRQKTRDLKE
jgi:hypothetical protein